MENYWLPILDSHETKVCGEKIKEIASALKTNVPKEMPSSLLSGKGGIALFFAYLCRTYDEPSYYDSFSNLVSDCIQDLSVRKFNYDLCTGYSGSMWLFTHFIKEEFLDADIEELEKKFDFFISEGSLRDLKDGLFDYLYNALGGGFYFIEKLPNLGAKLYLERFVLQLEAWWESNDSRVFSVGLAHGLSSVILFLSKVYSAGIFPDKTLTLLKECVNRLLNFKLPQNSLSCFPTSIQKNENLEDSRLGWCHGDLGVAISLWHAGVSTNFVPWKEEAIQIMLKNSYRKDLKENFVNDAPFCHGTAGIAHIFNRFFQATNNPIFKETSRYWYNETIKQSKFNDGLAGYKYWLAEEGFVNNTNLLVGIAGIGLSLLSAISWTEPNWDRCLLLS